MDQLAEMRVFVRAIERGTFAVAANDLGLTPSAVSKLILRLETRLGVRLVNRTTRKLALTAEGEAYFHSGRRLIEAIDGLEHEVAASAAHPRELCASTRRCRLACSTWRRHSWSSNGATPMCVLAFP